MVGVETDWVELEFTAPERLTHYRCGGLWLEGLEEGEEQLVEVDSAEVTSGSYLDGWFQENPGCDIVSCDAVGLEKVRRFKARRIGRFTPQMDPLPGEELPPDWRDAGAAPDGGSRPVYAIQDLSGRVQVDLQYYVSDGCAGEPELFQSELNLKDLDSTSESD